MKTVLDISASGADRFTMNTDAGVAYCIHNDMNTISKNIVKKRMHPGDSVHYPFQSLPAFYIFSYLSLSLQQVPSTPCFPTVEMCSNDYTPLIIKSNERAGVYETVATIPGKKKRTSVPVGGRADSATRRWRQNNCLAE